MATSATPQNDVQVVAKLIDDASRDRRLLIEGITYIALQDLLVIKCGAFWLPLDVGSIAELKGISREDLAHVRLSPGGGSIILDKYDIYIEAPMLVAEMVEQIVSRGDGGLIAELLRYEFKRKKRSSQK